MIKIRKANPTDYDEIYNLVKTAFKTACVSNGEEQNFVYALRKRAGYIEDLELVCEKDGQMVGHVMFTKQVVKADSDVKALLLAPLCVSLECRNEGIGGLLIREGFSAAKKLGYTAVFLTGNPEYYGRFGFFETGRFGIKNASEVPNQFVLGCELIPGALDGVGGSVLLE